MLYESDFPKFRNIHTNSDSNLFSVIITKNKTKKCMSDKSLAAAAKPLIYFATLFGSRFIKFTRNDITLVDFVSSTYSILIIAAMATLMIVIKPISWSDTRTDIPLNILTKTFGLINICEAIYSVFIITFSNAHLYVELFKKLDNVDRHFHTSQLLFRKRRFLSTLLVFLPIVLVSCTFWLRTFRIENVGAHLTFLLLMLQGAIFCFIISNIYMDQLILNNLLAKRILGIVSSQKKIIYQNIIATFLLKVLLRGSRVIDTNSIKDHCWYELMQMYDKLADCIRLFNQIYSGQVFIMYNSWLLCTLLIICRSLSPSIKYSEVFSSDLFLYSCINGRPIFLAIMCQLFITGRKKTLCILVQILLRDFDGPYYDQVQTMLMLVQSRKLEISARVFTVDVQTVMTFSGRIISYTVLMIQYFYMHAFLE